VDAFPSDLAVPLAWVEAIARREVARLRARYVLSPDELRGRLVGDAQVDALLSSDRATPVSQPLAAEIEHAELELGRWLDGEPAWSGVAARFGLGEAELRTLLLALAPETEARFARVYAYLNDHAGRGWLTRELSLRLLDGPETALPREALAADAPLLRSGLLRMHDDQVSGWSQTGLCLDPIVAHVLQGFAPVLAPVASGCELLHGRTGPLWSSETSEALARLSRMLEPSEHPPWLAFHGRPGSGRTAAAAALAARLGVPAVRADLDALALSGGLSRLRLLQALAGAIALVDADRLIDADGRPRADILPAVAQLAEARTRIVWRSRSLQDVEMLAAGRHRLLAVDFDRWTADDRALLWVTALAEGGGAPPALDVHGLASRFRLTPGQIPAAAARAREAAGVAGHAVEAADVFDAAREQSRTGLGRLAVRVEIKATWSDLVLPDETLEDLHGVMRAVRYRDVVFERWGVGRHTARGRGTLAIFSGPPGTGKTLSAEVLAGELELDLYRIELSAVVSKYIGETEANLQRVFEAAHDVDAMLLFDECDALFGKRSEVKDAHDRYANTEIAYLLQAIENHASDAGPVVLCTNRRGDLDGAFLRRVQHVVEFPFPKSVALRRALFERHLPPGVPRADDVDLDFLAENFELAGGDIRNAVLDAALRAAADDEPVRMRHLVHAMARQFRKRGTTPTPSHFKQYYALLQRPRAGLVA
jgi:SpoVK/Ycf46/Vps4 family AAA+-type ATPase